MATTDDSLSAQTQGQTQNQGKKDANPGNHWAKGQAKQAGDLSVQSTTQNTTQSTSEPMMLASVAPAGGGTTEVSYANLQDFTLLAGESDTFNLSGYSSYFNDVSNEVLEVKVDGQFVPLQNSGIDWIRYDGLYNRLTVSPSEANAGTLEMRFAGEHPQVAIAYVNVNLVVEAPVEQDDGASAEGDTSDVTYWYTYDNDGRVLIDGGQFNATDNTIELGKEGQQLFYDVEGRQSAVIRNEQKTAELFYYDEAGNLTGIRRGFFEDDSQTFALSFDLAALQAQFDAQGKNVKVTEQVAIAETANATWSQLVSHEYNDAGQKVMTKEYFAPETLYTKLVQNNQTRYLKHAAIRLVDSVSRIVVNSYNKDGQIELVNEYRRKPGELDTDLAMLAQEYFIELVDKDLWGHDTVYKGTVGWPTNTPYQTTTYDYDERGLVIGHQVLESGAVKNYDYHYVGSMSYLEAGVSGDGKKGEDGTFLKTSTFSYYDQNDNRYLIEGVTAKNKGEIFTPLEGSAVTARYFSYTQQGQVMTRRMGTQEDTRMDLSGIPTGEEVKFTTYKDDDGSALGSAYTFYMYAGNNYLGEIDADGKSTIKKQHFESATTQSASNNQRYVAQKGDTLRGLAQIYYGNGDLWYIIADANGVSPDGDAALEEGIALNLPDMARTSNTFSDFKLQNMGEIIGDTTPSMPYVKNTDTHCNVLAHIIVAAVTVIATIYGGPMAGNFAG